MAVHRPRPRGAAAQVRCSWPAGRPDRPAVASSSCCKCTRVWCGRPPWLRRTHYHHHLLRRRRRRQRWQRLTTTLLWTPECDPTAGRRQFSLSHSNSVAAGPFSRPPRPQSDDRTRMVRTWPGRVSGRQRQTRRGTLGSRPQRRQQRH